MNKWFINHNKVAVAKLRLFCFHHSGGTASCFKDWREFLPSEVELIAVQFPGRDARNSEPLITDMNAAVKQITDAFNKYQMIYELPFVFFGHSLGSLIAFEIANELRKRNLKAPQYLIVSGRTAPQTQPKEEVLHDLTDDLFVKGLTKYQGMPTEILQNKELLEVLLPRLRADFTLSETYQYKEKPPLECPILAIGGKDDSTVNYNELVTWKKQTLKKCTVNVFSGGHFFLSTSKKDVLSVIYPIITSIYNKDASYEIN